VVGLQGGEKKFDDIFGRLDTVPACVTDIQPASQPAIF